MEINYPIFTERLMLNCFTLEDAAKVFEMSQEKGMKDWVPDQVYESEKEAEDVVIFLIEQFDEMTTPLEKPYVFGIYLKESKELIGHAGLSQLGDSVEIGFAIEEKYQNQGFASEALTAFVKWGLDTFNLNNILRTNNCNFRREKSNWFKKRNNGSKKCFRII